jgi:opacity protein-like surface antigen
MRALRRVGAALLLALAPAASVSAQSAGDRVSFNAAVGPSFANVGTTFSALANIDFTVNRRTSLVGEVGMLRHAPFADAARIAAPPTAPSLSPRVNGYHWNGNVRVQPFDLGRLRPYVTGGLGTFTADTIVADNPVGPLTVEDRRRVTNFSTNLGAGASYPLNDWIGLTADYRTFFIHRDGDTPAVHRFAAGLTVSVK